MSAFAAKYKRNYYESVKDGPSNTNPCLRCLQHAHEVDDAAAVCTIVGKPPPANTLHKCARCQMDKNADCMQVCTPVRARMAQNGAG